MKSKHIGRIALALLLTLALLVPTGAMAAPRVVRSPQKLTVDGQNVACEKYNIDGYNYFKLRDLACLLSGTGSEFSVGFDDASKTVYISRGEKYTPRPGDLEPGEDKSASAVVSSQPIVIDGAVYADLSAFLIGNNNYFKLQ